MENKVIYMAKNYSKYYKKASEAKAYPQGAVNLFYHIDISNMPVWGVWGRGGIVHNIIVVV